MAKAFQKVFPYPAMARLCLSKIQVTKTKFILAQFQYSFQSAEMISKCFGNSSVPAVFLGCKRHDQQHEVIVGDFYWGPISLRNTVPHHYPPGLLLVSTPPDMHQLNHGSSNPLVHAPSGSFYSNETIFRQLLSRSSQPFKLFYTHPGRISLYGGEKGSRPTDTEFAEGNVYLDEQPICDDQWGIEEAKVACRSVIS